MATTTALVPTHDTPETALTAAPVSSLPTITELRQKMVWMTEFRAVLHEFIAHHMDPARHFYSFESNRYTPLTRETAAQLLAQGQKPALNQDGIHNLMSLYECYPDEPQITELRADGHYTCRATVKLISFNSGKPMGAGTGSCSTRESKYAYRWVYAKDVPTGMDKNLLRKREFEGRDGKRYARYRLENEDLADVEGTVLQMAVKRAKSAAVKCLPLVSEMFAEVGDPDEEKHDGDAGRQLLLTPIGAWLRQITTAAARIKAILAVFGEPLNMQEVMQLDEERLAVAAQLIEIGTKAGLDWASPTIVEDLRAARRTSAQQAIADISGDMPSHTPSRPASVMPTGARTPSLARDVLEAHRDDARVPTALLEQIASALTTPTLSESQLATLAEEVLAALGEDAGTATGVK